MLESDQILKYIKSNIFQWNDIINAFFYIIFVVACVQSSFIFGSRKYISEQTRVVNISDVGCYSAR